tara:strand:- start:11999 stop:14188 length:2190 start_codon:yes stop_codon:yes gene_type:complete
MGKAWAGFCALVPVLLVAPVTLPAQEIPGSDQGAFDTTIEQVTGLVQIWKQPTLGFYGAPGLLDMPAGTAMKDGDVSLTSAYFHGALRNTLSFQISPRLSGSFRYAILDDFALTGNRYDRSFDLRYLLAEEGDVMPAVTIGLRDFGGAGEYASEFIAATKTIDRVRVTGGIGWGRLGTHNGFSNPLGVLSNKIKSRPAPSYGANDQLVAGDWFRGDAALFGGIQYQPSERLVFTAEYSSDAYPRETARTDFKAETPFNFGATYRFTNGLDLTASYMYGTEAGLMLTYTMNPKSPKDPSGLEAGGPPIIPRDRVAALGWDANVDQPSGRSNLQTRLAAGMAGQGLRLEAVERTSPTSVTVHIDNQRYGATPQALGRAARVLANTLPPQVETMTIVPMANGMALSAVTLQRSDLEDLEFAFDGSWEMYSRARIADANDLPLRRDTRLPDTYPRFTYALGSYVSPSYFDSDTPVKIAAGAQLSAAYLLAPGLALSGQLRLPLVSNLDEISQRSASGLPHVRSDAPLYYEQADVELNHLTAEYFYRPGQDLYGRVTAGYLESMYAGLSGEVLWKPVAGPVAFGVEVNYARKRDFDMRFGVQDYDVITGHASAYYDFGNSFIGELDAGRYLAGDWGATVSLDREFANGFRVGAFMTLTDVPFDDFGEGSFDKGIRFWIPLSRVSGDPSKSGYGQTIRPQTGDGGARLNIRNRLYEVVRGSHASELQEDWGRFWR